MSNILSRIADASICNSKQRSNNDKCRCECKELIGKGICDKGFIWNPSNCEYECDKLSNFGEYLDYAHCKRRKILIDKLVEECTENIDEVKIAKITLMHSAECNSVDDENKCKSSCTIYVVLIGIIFTTFIGIGTYFIYYKYINHDKKLLLDMIMFIKHQIINMNGKYQRNKH